MSILRPIPPEQLRREFTHYGWLWFCPVYLCDLPHGDPPEFSLVERNGIPAFVLAAAFGLEYLRIFVDSLRYPGEEPAFAVLRGEPIPGSAGELERDP